MHQYFGVIGKPIMHSLSPLIHQYFAQQARISLIYDKMEGDERLFEQQVSDFFIQNGKGLNITLPFKQRAFAMAQQSTQRCQLAGAANTLWYENNQLNADNTDGIGLIRDLARYVDLPGKNILILGTGGAARGIIYPLLALNPAHLMIANRTVENAARLKEHFPQINYCGLDNLEGSFDLIINATSASLDGKPVSIPENMMQGKPFCYDLAYEKNKMTAFVQYAKSLGCEAMDGIGMLVEQAAEAFFIWHNIKPETETLLTLLRQ